MKLMWVLFISSILLNVPCYGLSDPLYYGSCDESNFVIRWQYQHFCDHVYDPRTDIWRWPTDEKRGITFDPLDVQPGDTIFVRMFPEFFNDVHPKIQHPYILVSAGECLDKMEDSYKQYLDEENVIAWFGIHANKMAMNHPKFHAIPIGVLQRPEHYKKRDKLNSYFKELRLNTKKEFLVYMNFAYQETKPERIKLRKRFLHEPYCKRAERVEFKDYLKQMAQSYFTLSPKGLAPDCYRTWEALLVGSIPVVKRSFLDPLYEDLPVLIVDSWDDVTEDFLRASYKKMMAKKYDIKRLYTTYWTDKIKEVQQSFREGTLCKK